MTEGHLGAGKTLQLECDFLGALKQAPVLIDALNHRMPCLEISLLVNRGDAAIDEFNRDLERIRTGLSACIRTIGRKETCSDVKVDFCLHADTFQRETKRQCAIPVDPLKYEERPLLCRHERDGLRKKFGITNEKVIVAGSMHRFEMPTLLAAVKYASGRTTRPLKTLVVPRFSGWTARTEARDYDLRHRRGSTLWFPGKNPDVITVGGYGLLDQLYSIADIAVIGNTLRFPNNQHGQNPLEPALYGCRMVSGPSPKEGWNGDAFKGLEASGLLRMVASENELSKALAQELSPAELYTSRQKAATFIESKRGAAQEYASRIQEVLYE